MAEEEKIREHAKQALQALTDKKKGWKEKLKDFLWEILIIVIAINLTLWFHSWNDKRHDRELEKNFLIGTREDLNNVKESLNSFFEMYQQTIDYYDSVWVQMNENRIDTAFIDSNSRGLTNVYPFTYNNSRFESFKSSGYIRLIKNSALLESITFLFTVKLPQREALDNMIFNNRLSEFTTYIGSKARIDSSGKIYVSKLLNNSEVKFQIYKQRTLLHEMKSQKQDLLQMVDAVITQINQELKMRFKYEVKNEKEIKNASR